MECSYTIEDEGEGSITFIRSSRGMEDVVAASAADNTGSYDVGNSIIDYIKLTDTSVGCKWVSVLAKDTADELNAIATKNGVPRRNMHGIKYTLNIIE